MLLLSDLLPHKPAEARILEESKGGVRVSISDGSLPDQESAETEVRAEFLKAMLFDPNGPGLAKGLRLRGAWISGALDLQGVALDRDISLSHCVLAGPISLLNAKLRGLFLTSVRMQSLSADQAEFDGSLYIRGGSEVSGEISLAGTRIKGDIQICDAVIRAEGQDAIFAPQLVLDGSLFLGNYPYSDGETTLTTEGMLFFSSLRAAHDVFVSHCAIAPHEDPLLGGVFGETEEHGRGIALSFARAQVGGLLYLQDLAISRGVVNLAGATVARLADEPDAERETYPIRLDGFRYTDFSRHTTTSLKARLNWLERRPADTPFTAQPYEQLSQVLSAMGHRLDAQAVLMRKERAMRAEDRALMTNPGRLGLAWAADLILRGAIGYGYKPARALIVSIVLILTIGLFFQKTWNAGDMAPNAAPILVSRDWIAATQSHPDNPAAFWSQPGQAGQDFETFNAFSYAADLLIPIVDLGQESAWAPSTSRSPLGRVGWWLRWFAKAVGWVVTALVAAALTGVIRRE